VTCDPPNLREDETRTVARPIEGGQPWTDQDVLHLSEAKFGVTYHPNYM
jgi:transposase